MFFQIVKFIKYHTINSCITFFLKILIMQEVRGKKGWVLWLEVLIRGNIFLIEWNIAEEIWVITKKFPLWCNPNEYEIETNVGYI